MLHDYAVRLHWTRVHTLTLTVSACDERQAALQVEDLIRQHGWYAEAIAAAMQAQWTLHDGALSIEEV